MGKYTKKFIWAMSATTLMLWGFVLFMNHYFGRNLFNKLLTITLAVILLYLFKNSWWKVYELQEMGEKVIKENILPKPLIAETDEVN